MTPIPNFDPLLVKLESFEGPLDLLLHLIQKKKKIFTTCRYLPFAFLF